MRSEGVLAQYHTFHDSSHTTPFWGWLPIGGHNVNMKKAAALNSPTIGIDIKNDAVYSLINHSPVE